MRTLLGLSATLILVALSGCGERERDPELVAIRAKLDAIETQLNQSKTGPTGHAAAATDPRQAAPAAMQSLLDGQRAFLAGTPRDPDLSSKRRAELGKGQKPYAVIVGCSDSRCPPEHVFGAGLGDLFVVRTAGNVVPDDVVASVEYAVAHLGVQVIVCVGHSRCGAVTAAVNNARETPAVAALVDHIEPAVASARSEGHGGAALIERAIVLNAFRCRDELLAHSALLRERAEAGQIHFVVARQQLDNGRIDWLDAGGLNGVPLPPADPLFIAPSIRPTAHTPSAAPEPVLAIPAPVTAVSAPTATQMAAGHDHGSAAMPSGAVEHGHDNSAAVPAVAPVAPAAPAARPLTHH